MWSNGYVPERAALAAIVVVAAVVAAALVVVTRDRRRARRTLASLDALLVHAPVGIGFLDRHLRFVRVNDAMGRIGRRDPEQYVGLTMDETVGRPELTAIVRSVLETGVPVFDVELSGTAADGRPYHALAGYYPVHGPDGINGVGVIARDVTASVEAGAERGQLLTRVTRLQRVTAALAAASGTDDDTDVVLGDVRRAAGADAVSLVLSEDGELEILASEGYRPDVIEPYRRMPIDAEVPIAGAVREARPVIAATRQEIIRRWPGTAPVLGPERRADGSTEAIDCAGTLLGVFPDAELADVALELGPGDSLVLYTDGVTERHAGARFFDEDALAGALSRCAGFTATAIAEHIGTASRAFVEDALRDDLAIVVVRVPSSTATATSTAVDLPVDATAPTMGRRFVTAALEALGLEEYAEVAELLVSEVVTNAFLHAEGPFRLAVEPAGSTVRVAVTDGSALEPAVQPLDDETLHGRGTHLVDVLAARWGVEHVGTGKSVWFELAAP